jgi:hypothetical protein
MGVLQCDNIVQSTDNVCIILDARAPIAPGAGSVEWAQYLELKGSYKMPRSGLTALAWFALKGKEPAWDGHAVILGTLGEGTLREHGIPTNVKCFHKDAMHHSREREDFFKEIDRILQLTRKP